jgi:alpha-galactosidase
MTGNPGTFIWGDDAFALHLTLGDAEGPPRLLGFDAPTAGRAALPLVEVELTGHGRSGTSGKRHVDGLVSRRLRYESHQATPDRLTVRMRDAVTGLRVAAQYRRTPGLAVVTAWASSPPGRN